MAECRRKTSPVDEVEGGPFEKVTVTERPEHFKEMLFLT